MTDIDHDLDECELTDEECLGYHPDSPCRGHVRYRYALPIRWRNNGTAVMFPRCAKHYDEYELSCRERERRAEEYEASLYCKHGTYVGDWAGADYLCGLCESE